MMTMPASQPTVSAFSAPPPCVNASDQVSETADILPSVIRTKAPSGTLPEFCDADGHLKRLHQKTNILISNAENLEWELSQSWNQGRIDGLGDDGWNFQFSDSEIQMHTATATKFLAYDAAFGSNASITWPTFFNGAYPELESFPLNEKIALWTLRANYVRSLPTNSGRLLNMIEYFSGSGRMCLQHLVIGCVVAAFDKIYSEDHNCTLPDGQRLWLDALSGTSPTAVTWLGTKCAPYLNMCIYNHNRRPSNGYLGNTNLGWVQTANTIASFSAMIYYLSHSLENNPLLEQPAESCLPKMSIWESVLGWTNSVKSTTSLRRYGADTLKPLQIWHSNGAYSTIQNKDLELPRSEWKMEETLAEISYDKNGKKRYSGKRKQMRESEEYPVRWCVKVARISIDVIDCKDAVPKPATETIVWDKDKRVFDDIEICF